MSRRIPLPPGKIGATLSGSPPMVTEILTSSPMLGKLNIGDVIDGICVPNRLKVQHIEDAYTLTALLQKTSHLQRSLLVITDDYSSTSMDATETEFHVTIPPGKIGITFEGEQQPTIAKVWDYCPVKGFVEEGQWIKSILIPGEPELVCSHLSARSVYEVLRTRARYEGRVIVLTNPPIAVAQPVSHPVSSEPQYTPIPRPPPATSHDLMSISSGCSAPLSVSPPTSPCNNNPQSNAQCSIDATIDGRMVTIQLGQGQGVRADHDNMIYMTSASRFQVKRHAMIVSQFARGYPLGMTEFIYEGSARIGTVAFASGDKVISLKLEDYGGKIFCQAGSYLCCETSVGLYIETAPSSNEGFVFLRLVGTGYAWLSGSGTIIKKTLVRGESLKCATGAVMAYEKTVQHFTHRVSGGLKSVLSGKECFWTELTGPGCVWLQGSVGEATSFPTSDRAKRTNGVLPPRDRIVHDTAEI